MRINSHVSYLSDEELEALADDLIDRYEAEIEAITEPPVPVEKIADFLLELNIEWFEIPDSDQEPILAYLDPASKTVRLNEQRLPYFEQYPGTYEYTLAHEIGHYQLHLIGGDSQPGQKYLCRQKQTGKDRREWQAERFASYLLMPASLLLPAIDGLNLPHWPNLYRLRDQFNVSITALRIRLERLDYLHLGPNGRLYANRQAAATDRQQELRRLIGQGQICCQLDDIKQAKAVYHQALELAGDLKDRRNEAFLAWQLGQLYAETDPGRAVVLMSRCVAYEREINHPNAEADARHVARLKARLY